MNASDEIKEKILKLLYDIFKNARSDRSAQVTRVVIFSHLREDGHTDQEIMSNLMYLVDTGWVKKEGEPYSIPSTDPFTRKKTTIKGKTIRYRISDTGINHIEGPSKFQKPSGQTGINVTNVQGVTIIGDNNIVNNDLFNGLDVLKQEIGNSVCISDEERINFTADIDTIKSQLAKPSPSKTIIQAAWQGLSGLATIEGLMQLYQRVAPLIEKLMR